MADDEEAVGATVLQGILAELTPRAREVFLLACRGLATFKIAKQLGISDQTVKNHLTAAYGALEVAGLRSGQYSKRGYYGYLLGIATGLDRAKGPG